MDNLTHSLTGALAARFIESRSGAPDQKEKYRATFFWLFVVAANVPDIDVLLGLFGDPLFSIQYHRGLTHSLLFAPVLAFFPALLFLLFSKVKNIRLLWIISLLGIIIHIFFDLVTSFGTRILDPLSATRYSLDWVFIVDPVLTVGLILFLLLGKLFIRQSGRIVSAGIAFTFLYIVLTALNHSAAYDRVKQAARGEKLSWTRISALPQPFSPFSWQGLVQTETEVRQTFFSLFDTSPLTFRVFRQAEGNPAAAAALEPEAEWFLTFARHPLVRMSVEGEKEVVEFSDLMFSVDGDLMRSLGFTERSLPFVLKYMYDMKGNLVEVDFDGKRITR